MSNTDVSSIATGIIEYLEKIGKLAELPQIIKLLQKQIKNQSTLVRVESAQALSEDEKSTINDWIIKNVGQTSAQFNINPDLVGGLKIYVGDQCLDLSVVNKVNKLYAK